jgi:hypothetical protein
MVAGSRGSAPDGQLRGPDKAPRSSLSKTPSSRRSASKSSVENVASELGEVRGSPVFRLSELLPKNGRRLSSKDLCGTNEQPYTSKDPLTFVLNHQSIGSLSIKTASVRTTLRTPRCSVSPIPYSPTSHPPSESPDLQVKKTYVK